MLEKIFLYLKELIEPENVLSLFSATATIMAAYLTYKIAKSSDSTSKRSVKIADQMRKMEIVNEAPQLYVREIRKTGEKTYTINIKNSGHSEVINIDLVDIKLGVSDAVENPLTIIPGSAGVAHFEYENGFYVGDIFILEYQNVVGNKLETIFTIKEIKQDIYGDIYFVENNGIKLIK